MKIKATQRIKRRYLLIEGKKEEIEKSILDYIGILGWAKATPVFVKHSENKIILSLDRKHLSNIRAAFAISESKINVLKVSGTIKGLQK
jgi:RNase P/RNase MRP subunit POP5